MLLSPSRYGPGLLTPQSKCFHHSTWINYFTTFLCMCRLASNILCIASLSWYICHQHDQLQNLFEHFAQCCIYVCRTLMLHVWNDSVSFFIFVLLKIFQTFIKFSINFGYEFSEFNQPAFSHFVLDLTLFIHSIKCLPNSSCIPSRL